MWTHSALPNHYRTCLSRLPDHVIGERNSLGRTADGRPCAQRRSGSVMRWRRQSHRETQPAAGSRRAYTFWSLLLVHQRSCTRFAARHVVATRLYINSTSFWEPDWETSQNYQFRTYSGFRLALQSISAGWEFDVWHHWHYPPFWHQSRPHTLSSLSSYTTVITCQTYIGTTSWVQG